MNYIEELCMGLTTMNKRLLFVCSCNLNRSPTFEHYFKEHHPEYEVKSCGVYAGYPLQLNQNLLEWADEVIVMDCEQAYHIWKHFRDFYDKVHIAGISDQYDTDDGQLKFMIQFWEEIVWKQERY